MAHLPFSKRVVRMSCSSTPCPSLPLMPCSSSPLFRPPLATLLSRPPPHWRHAARRCGSARGGQPAKTPSCPSECLGGNAALAMPPSRLNVSDALVLLCLVLLVLCLVQLPVFCLVLLLCPQAVRNLSQACPWPALRLSLPVVRTACPEHVPSLSLAVSSARRPVPTMSLACQS